MRMKSKGNGAPQQCVENLLRIARGEVPYERLKGIDPRYIDKPFSTARHDLVADVDWMIRTYEPRSASNGIELVARSAQAGAFEVKLDINVTEGGEQLE